MGIIAHFLLNYGEIKERVHLILEKKLNDLINTTRKSRQSQDSRKVNVIEIVSVSGQ